MSTTLNAGTATGGAAISADTTGILQLQSGSTPTTAITIDTSQNVGIGTTPGAFKLDVNGVIRSSASLNPYLALNTTGSATTDYVQADANGVDITSSGARRFTVTTNNTERMRIDSSGNLLINTTSLNAGKTNIVSAGSSQPCMVWNDSDATSSSQGIVSIRRNGSAVGLISTTNTNTTYATSSDYRLKENIVPMVGALATVSALKPVTYKWKSTGEESQGFIAHELQSVLPDCVTGEKDAVDAEGKPVYQGIDTSFLVATLTAAIQEQQDIIKSLIARIEALESK